MLKESLTVLGIGFSVVFIGLLCLIGIIYLMSFIVSLVRQEGKHAKRNEEHPHLLDDDLDLVAPVSYRTGGLPASGEKRRETVAAVSAAIAEYLGEDVSGIKIHSIRRVGAENEAAAPADRRELVAVISAAIATELGTDVSGIRIHSIRKVA
ncbi:MAG: OadG family protein [Clostridiales bacterium]|nr:OadG family protein [Clostridiales bacterium]